MSNPRQRDGRETRDRLVNWVKGQHASEPLAARLLASDGYSSVDPSHPLGGKDGKKDALLSKDGLNLVLGVYFPRGQQSFSHIKEKFSGDLDGVNENGADGFVFFTNQELKLGERSTLRGLNTDIPIELYHLDRVATLLDVPVNYGIRTEFLDISMTNEELVALYAQRDQQHLEQLQELSTKLEHATEQLVGHVTGGDSYLRFGLRCDPSNQVEVAALIEGATPHQLGMFALSKLDIEIVIPPDQVLHRFPSVDVFPSRVAEFPALTIPQNKNFMAFYITVNALNGSYAQYFMLKKFTDGKWYSHSIRFDDVHHACFRQEEFDPNYPEALKIQEPHIDSYRPKMVGEDPTEYRKQWDWLRKRTTNRHYGL